MIKNEQKQLESLREEITRKLTRTENQKLEIDQERNRLLSKTHSLKNGTWLLNIVGFLGYADFWVHFSLLIAQRSLISTPTEMEAKSKLQAEDKKRIEGLERELELLKKEKIQASEFADKEENLRKAHEQTVRYKRNFHLYFTSEFYANKQSRVLQLLYIANFMNK